MMSNDDFNVSAEYEAEVIPGIEDVSVSELRSVCGARVSDIRRVRAGFLRFQFRGDPSLLGGLRSVIAIYHAHLFAIPRPKALLGHQHFTRLIAILRATSAPWILSHHTFGIGAAGSDSSVMRRLRRETGRALQMAPASDGKGELYFRLQRSRDKRGWELLVRLTPQPLSKRAYRVVDLPGALNATAAYAMTDLRPHVDKASVLNLCSGSSTILIEHALRYPQDALIAMDNNREILDAGRRNASAAGQLQKIDHNLADARRVPLPSQSIDMIYADLPFGHHMGSHELNQDLYPGILLEAERLARPNAVCALLTHEVKLLRNCLRNTPWTLTNETTINLSGLHPRLFVLKRNSAKI